MSTGRGHHLGGVRDFDGIKCRCTIVDDEPSPCWQWDGAIDKRGSPKIWFAPFNSTATMAALMCYLKTGKRARPGTAWHPRCMNRSCGNPEHWRSGTHSQATRRHPRKNPELHAAKVAAARQAKSILDAAAVADIRSSDDSLDAAAQRHGVSRSTISRIRLGQQWKPLVLPTSSVFLWGGA